MTVQVVEFPSLDLRWVKYSGTVTADDLDRVAEIVYGHGSGRPLSRSFLDLEDVGTIGARFSDFATGTDIAAEHLRRCNVTLRLACHAPSDLTYGSARMYVTLLNNTGVAKAFVSRNRAQAAGWLALGPAVPHLPDFGLGRRLTPVRTA